MILRALLATLLALALAAPAQAATQVQTVQGRIFYSAAVTDQAVHFSELAVATAEPGSIVSIYCEHCPDKGKKRHVPASGLLSFQPFLGTGTTAADVQITDREGRTLSLEFDHEFASLQVTLHFECFNPGSNDVVSCLTKCPPRGSPIAPDSPCVNAYGRPRLDHAGETDLIDYTEHGSIFDQLALTKMPRGASVLVLCRNPGHTLHNCPFYVKAFAQRHHRVSVAGALGHIRLKPGTIVDLWLTQGQETADVLEFTVRPKRLPRVQKLCVAPTLTVPGRCPH
jgi:hypothetical protein